MKRWYQSKTLWFNALSVAAIAVQYMIDNQMLLRYAAIEGLIIAVVNGVLRLLFTDTNLTK